MSEEFVDSALSRVLFLFFRRMRTPLIVLILTYSISAIGLVLILGTDADGNTWRFDFFHAFYFVSFMGSTIGFGELGRRCQLYELYETAAVSYEKAHALAPGSGPSLTPVRRVIENGLDKVLQAGDDDRRVRFERFRDGLEAILSYLRAAGARQRH